MPPLPAWFEPVRMVALCLIYIMFFLQLYSVRITYRQFKKWTEDEAERRERWMQDEAARRERWAQDMAIITKLTEEAYHQRAQAEVALAQARRHVPADGA